MAIVQVPVDGDVIAVWFSNGAASAVAWKEAVRRYGDRCTVLAINSPVVEEDPDNLRFASDVSRWVGAPLLTARNPSYPTCSAEDVWERRRAEPQHERVWRLFAVRAARRVEHLMTDPRSRSALDVAERHAAGTATDEELAAAGAAAWAAARAATRAAWDAARDAAWDAAWGAAWDAAGAARAAWDAQTRDFLELIGSE